MLYLKDNPIETGGPSEVKVFVSQHIDRTNVFFEGKTGVNGRVVHVMNGWRFACSRKPLNAPYIYEDEGIDHHGSGVRQCQRCYHGLEGTYVPYGAIKIDVVRLRQMHFSVLSRAIANAYLLMSGRYDYVESGVAVSDEKSKGEAFAFGSNLSVDAFNTNPDSGRRAFWCAKEHTEVLDKMPKYDMDIVGGVFAKAFTRCGVISVVRASRRSSPHLMTIANSGTLYYMPIEFLDGGDSCRIRLLPYEEVDYSDY